jgi:hypothetical protein
MKQNQWQILFFIMIFMTIYVLFNPEMYNSILGRSVVVFTIVLLAKYNIMLGLGLVLVAIFMYPDANYMSYMEGMTGDATAPTSTAPSPSPVAAKKEEIKAKVATPTVATPAVATPLPKAQDLQTALTEKMTTLAAGMAKLGVKSKPTEGFTENKKYSGTTDRIAKEERMRPRSSVTPQLYQGRGHGVSTSGYQEPSPNSDLNSLGFAFLS